MTNKFKLATMIALSAVMVASSSAPIYAATNSRDVIQTRRLVESGAARAPLGFQIFCLTNKSHCRGGGRSSVAFSDALLKKLNSVNRSVNRSIRPRRDRGDVWSINVKSGDCEDYVLTKRSRLISAGVSASALRIAYVKTRSGISHAVLIIRTNKGDFVLDNLNNRIKEWNKTGLKFIAMSGSNPRHWSSV